MEDIEDLIGSEDYWESNSRAQRNYVLPTVRRRNKITNIELAKQVKLFPYIISAFFLHNLRLFTFYLNVVKII